MWVAGRLVVNVLDCKLKESQVPAPLAAEIYFSSRCTQPYLKNLSRRFPITSFERDVKLFVLWNLLVLSSVLLEFLLLTGLSQKNKQDWFF